MSEMNRTIARVGSPEPGSALDSTSSMPRQSSRASASRHRGFSLLEIVLVIAIGFGLITVGITAYGNANRRAKEVELTSRANIISAAIFSNYSKRGDYRGITLD